MSNGLQLLMGQISKIVFILGMDGFKNRATSSMTASLIALIGLMALNLFICTKLKEAKTLMMER
jgi:hypothetical protein